MTRALNLGTQEAEAVDVHEFKESLIYKASSRSAKAKWDPTQKIERQTNKSNDNKITILLGAEASSFFACASNCYPTTSVLQNNYFSELPCGCYELNWVLSEKQPVL